MGTDFLELLTRIQMHRINTDDQKHVVEIIMDFYGDKMRLGIDKTGVGFPIWDQLTRVVLRQADLRVRVQREHVVASSRTGP
jgi:hypothetical protein